MRKIFNLILIIGLFIGFSSPFNIVHAATLEQQQAELNRQIQANSKAIGNTKQDLSSVQSAISSIENQINSAQKDIDLSVRKIDLTSEEINQTQADIEVKLQELQVQKNNLFETVRVYYENSQTSTLEVVVSSNSLNDAIDRTQYLEAISSRLNDTMAAINQAKTELETKKKKLQDDKISMENQKAALVSKQQALQEQQRVKNGLLNDAQGTLSSLQGQQKDAQTRLNEVNAQIAALSGTSNWGSGIVSQNDGSWYYSQTGNYTNLGNSPYTVSQYGCLITSYAMVATYYGNRITPTDIANMWWHFSGGGYFQNGTSDLGISVTQSGPVNWGVVDQEISSGHPVIVSVYLPSVGAINGDGSSHFIVIKGRSGDTYLMHDPIGGGRSYGLDQIRSMKIIRPN